MANEGQQFALNAEAKEKQEKEQDKIIQAMRLEDAANRRVNARNIFLTSSYVVNGIKALNPENDFVVRRYSFL